MEQRVAGAEAMQAFAAEYAAALSPSESAAAIVTLSGALGAGKTTFAQGLARALGVEETVNSPTFVIEKIYALRNQRWEKLIHIDAYRLESADELRAIGWDEIVADPNNLVLLEWPERVPGAIPSNARFISIEIGEGERRTLTYGN